MSIAVSTWHLELVPGKKYEYLVERDFHVTNASLGDELADEKGRSVVKVSIKDLVDSDSDDEGETASAPSNTVLCSLRAGLVEQSRLDVTFIAGQELEWQVTGKNRVFLLGNFVDTLDMPPFGGEDGFDSDDEPGYRLEDVSSDVEMNAADLAGLDDSDSEDDAEPKPASKKRRRESDASLPDETPDLSKMSKNQRRKLAKKLKGEDGEAVPAGADSPAKSADEKPKTKKEAKAEKKKDDKPEKKDEKKEKKEKGETRTLAGGLLVRDVKPGTGPAARKGQRLGMRYIGKLQGGKVFDKNTTGPPFAFKLGRGEVIKGWDEGLVGMQVGGERVLTIPGGLAYGPRPPKGSGIPPNATLVFEVKLLSVA